MKTPVRRALRRGAPLAAVAVVIGGLPTATVAMAAEAKPPLSLVTATPTATVERFTGEPVMTDGLPIYAVAGSVPFDIRTRRTSYNKPVEATLYVGTGAKRVKKKLPKGLVTDVNTLNKFFSVTVRNAKGKVVASQNVDFCPNSEEPARYRPDAPARSPYPQECGAHPFALGAVLGIQKGWATPALGTYDSPVSFDGPDGVYTLDIKVRAAYRRALGLSLDKTKAQVKIKVKTVAEEPEPTRATTAKGHAHHSGPAAGDDTRLSPQRASAERARVRALGHRLKPAATRPAVRQAPAGTPRPDLRSLPALDVGLNTEDGSGRATRKTYLEFSATIWNAGPSPLVVDGFRRPGKKLMDAYQYFFDGKGKQVGAAPAGTLEWDAREGHDHWHFTAFGTYRLLDSTQKVAVRSGKESFCLLPTDPVDLRTKGAAWKVASTDLATACGGEGALSIRETLETGWGDTYSQSLPGQSFDITNVPNGTYYIEVVANPDGKLTESSRANNRSLRKVILGGSGNSRTVTVPRVGVIAEP